MQSNRKNIASELEDFIFQRMANSNILGLSIATIRENKLSYQKAFGFRDFIKGTSATTNTIYCIGSVTKSFTALAVMQLVEKGLLSLEDPIEEFIDIDVKAMGEPILVKHLLSHSSGLAALRYAETTLSAVTNTSGLWLPICSPQDLLIFMKGAEDWAISKPGQRYSYLNEGYILLGSIIERVSGERYAEYVKKHILNPLHMDRSSFLEIENDDDVATPYITSQNGERVPTRYPYGQMISDGGLMSNAMDMIRYLKMLLQVGELDGANLASPNTIRLMMEPKIRTTEEPVEGSGYAYYGYGFHIKSGFFGHDLIYHSGSVFGSNAYMGFIPDKKVGVIILANGGYLLEDMGEYTLAKLLDRDPMDAIFFKRTRILDELTGLYKTFRNTSNYKVTRNGGILQLETSYGQRSFTTPLIPVDLDRETKEFKVYWVDSTVPVQFIQRDKSIFMIFERNMAKKVCEI